MITRVRAWWMNNGFTGANRSTHSSTAMWNCASRGAYGATRFQLRW